MPETRKPVIALMTDFGLEDAFVGVVKGVILGINPDAAIVDIGHEFGRGDISRVSFSLMIAFPCFPPGTVFVVVVDPGVGTGRRSVAVTVDGRTVVCPDNGLLSWLLSVRTPSRAVELSNPKYFLPDVSTTFHGRDVFAPVAAHVSLGVDLAEFGAEVRDLVTFPVPRASIEQGCIRGEVVYIDGFGNLITNIRRAESEKWNCQAVGGEVRVQLGNLEVAGIRDAYGSVPSGGELAVFGSSGMIEIAVNGGSAAEALGGDIGTPVLVSRSQS